MGRFTRVSSEAFSEVQSDAGMVLKTFNPENPTEPADEDIVTATTGGVSIDCKPTYSDWGEDIDNVPPNTKELKHLDGWDVKMTFTGLGSSPESVKLALGAADIDSTNTSKIVPRRDLNLSDFNEKLWWVGDRKDGGFMAACILNALSTGGFSLKTTKNGKGQFTYEITGHVSLYDQETMPAEFYSYKGDDEVYTITNDLTNVTSSNSETDITEGECYTATLSAVSGYTLGTVTVTMGGANVTSTAYNSSTHKITIAAVKGDLVITAAAVQN